MGLTFYLKIMELYVSFHTVLYKEDQLLIFFYAKGSMKMNNDGQRILMFFCVDNEDQLADVAFFNNFLLSHVCYYDFVHKMFD